MPELAYKCTEHELAKIFKWLNLANRVILALAAKQIGSSFLGDTKFTFSVFDEVVSENEHKPHV